MKQTLQIVLLVGILGVGVALADTPQPAPAGSGFSLSCVITRVVT